MTPRSAQEMMKDNMLVKHYAGSHAYGTALPSSDIDFRGIFYADPINILTPFFPVREVEDMEEEDTKLYELHHFMKLCLDCNPNIVETLWVDDDDIVFRTVAYDLLREHRHKLLSAKIGATTCGYAMAQLKRIRGHNKWINNPQPKESPKPYQFLSVLQSFEDWVRNCDLEQFRDDYRLVPYGNNTYGVHRWKGCQLWDDAGGINDNYDDVEAHLLNSPVMLVRWNREEYKNSKEKHEQYWTWKRNRNKDRGKLEEEFGYDTKHAMHLVRLMRMGEEALRTGELIVKRPDADELLDIRNGSWTYEEIIKYAEEKHELVRDELRESTDLPQSPDIKFAANLLMQVQELVWHDKHEEIIRSEGSSDKEI